MLSRRFITIALLSVSLVLLSSTSVLAGTQLYGAQWTAESFGNDVTGVGTLESRYFEVTGIPMGVKCHPNAPLCDNESTPVTTTGTPSNPGAIGTVWNPLGPGCRPLITTGVGNGTNTETPRPAKGGTTPPRVPPLYRNPDHFTAGGAAFDQSCQASQTVSGSPATAYIAPFDDDRGKVMKGAPVQGWGTLTTTAFNSFKIPAAPASPGPGDGMFRTTTGSFTGEGPYLYSYTYATFRNDAGDFGPGKGFFSTGAATSTLMFQNKVGGSTVASIKVERGANRFGGVMKLLGDITTKVCYFYAGGCGLGYGVWRYDLVGASGYKDSKVGSPVITGSYTTSFVFTYYNTALQTIAKYDFIAQRFPWTTGNVTVTATGRGPHNTVEARQGFDNRNGSGIGTVQLVSPILTQWLGQGSAPKFETGGIGVLKVQFVPEPGVLVGLVAGLSLLAVMHRFRG